MNRGWFFDLWVVKRRITHIPDRTVTKLQHLAAQEYWLTCASVLDGWTPELRAGTGKGINPEALTHVFEPLWQAEGSRAQGGLGLGLAIVKNLVELHGGNIRAESLGTGKGARFILHIPWPQPGQKHARGTGH